MNRLFLDFTAFLVAILLAGSSVYEAVAVAFSVHAFLSFFSGIGQQIALLECIGFIATLEILCVPAITYWVFPASMPIESATYFSYALPACALFYVGLYAFTGGSLVAQHRAYVQRITAYLHDRQKASILLFVIGLAGFLVKLIRPDAPTFVGTLPMYCLLTSTLYAYYARSSYRVLLISLVVVLLLVNTVQTGMFGDLAFWLLLLLIFSSVGFTNPLTIRTKVISISSAFVLLLLIQSIKGEYRHRTWGYVRTERSADPALMADLLIDRVMHLEKLLNINRLFTSFVRFNQGIMIGSAMAKVPDYEAYANGEVLLSFVYPFVPRLLWPSKPQTGGYENIRRFTTLPQFENTSINLSPVGEGYVNFGYGGILFAGLYGALLGGFFRLVFLVAEHIPSAILWLPMLYIGCLTMETDLLSTWGSLVNSAVFITLLYGLLKQFTIEL